MHLFSKKSKIKFNQILDRLRIRIYPYNDPAQALLRDIRTVPFSHGLEYWGWAKQGWECAFIRCDDMVDPTMLNGLMQITCGMYHNPHGDTAVVNWGDVPVMTLEGGLFGGWNKDLMCDGVVQHSYISTVGNCAYGLWIEGQRINNVDDFTKILRVFHF
jgi:hypothetical protein